MLYRGLAPLMPTLTITGGDGFLRSATMCVTPVARDDQVGHTMISHRGFAVRHDHSRVEQLGGGTDRRAANGTSVE